MSTIRLAQPLPQAQPLPHVQKPLPQVLKSLPQAQKPPPPQAQKLDRHAPPLADEPEFALLAETAIINWSGIVARIQSGEDSAMEELYHIFAKGIRYYLCRQLGAQELDDKVHDTFLIVVQAIQRGDVREPERLMGFIRTVVRRQVAAYIDQVVHSRREELDLELGARIADRRRNPEQNVVVRQKVAMMVNVLKQMPERDREILIRFYLREEPQEQICHEMELTETQFRLFKSRAKARFGEIGKKKLQRSVLSFFLRTSA
jgi:RNA polymerase sigma-70 factor (ECF subfamily)